MKMTERSAKWAKSVLANCRENTGRSLDQWVLLARRAKVADAKGARDWAKKQGLSIVYATAVAETLFPPGAEDDDALIDAQYEGPRAHLRPIYDALIETVRALGADVAIMPRKSQVTCSRDKSFAVIRAKAKDRIDVALKLHGMRPTTRLQADAKAMASDPSHVVGVRARSEIDRELVAWLRAAYDRAGPKK
jgi:predicted transport protein